MPRELQHSLPAALHQTSALLAQLPCISCTQIRSPDAGEVWGGNPVRHLRALKPEESEYLLTSAEHYGQLASQHSTETSKTPFDRAGVV